MDIPYAARAFGKFLAESERMNPGKRDETTTAFLEKLIRFVASRNEHWRRYFAVLIRPDGSFNWAQWRNLRVLRRADLQANGEALAIKAPPAEMGAIKDGRTSGSTATSVSFFQTEFQAATELALTERVLRWLDVPRDAVLARIVADDSREASWPEGSSQLNWRIEGTGRAHLLGLHTDLDRQIDWLKRRSPDILATSGVNLGALGRRALETDAGVRFRNILSSVTTLTDQGRHDAEVAFGSRITDRYAASELGSIADQCPACGLYHVNAESFRVEVIDKAGTPCREGEMGEVVVTSLHAFATPLIRYALGDLAVVGPPRAPCGRTLPSLRRIIGRVRNIFVMPDGSLIAPHMRDPWNQGGLTVHRFQLVQTSIDAVVLRYMPLPADPPLDFERIAAFIRSGLHPAIEVGFERVDDLPLTAAGKFEDYISLVPNPYSR